MFGHTKHFQHSKRDVISNYYCNIFFVCVAVFVILQSFSTLPSLARQLLHDTPARHSITQKISFRSRRQLNLSLEIFSGKITMARSINQERKPVLYLNVIVFLQLFGSGYHHSQKCHEILISRGSRLIKKIYLASTIVQNYTYNTGNHLQLSKDFICSFP